ncbi:TetR/AcrR family transcriptional regulator [Roseovarius sp. C7]|uniref:TetR/AcrR family transcriptional regulator n=1 Tax=Roseovarius sp. C7 TaxID=3398643 RepID=UPI0039F6E58A
MYTAPHRSQSARDRLIQTARELFLQHGVPHVGINRVIEEAGIARMTLYNHFASKDDLVAAAFEQEVELRRQSITSVQDGLDGTFEKVLALFVVALELASLKGFRGCAFVNLAIEAAAPDSALHGLAKAHKDWILENIMGHLPPETFSEPDMLARQILVLWDGGIVGAYVHQSDAPIHAAHQAARALMRGAAS